jgi:hypothetical protein
VIDICKGSPVGVVDRRHDADLVVRSEVDVIAGVEHDSLECIVRPSEDVFVSTIEADVQLAT